MFKVGDEFVVVSGFDQGDHHFEHGSVVRLVELCQDNLHVYKNNSGIEQYLTKEQVERTNREVTDLVNNKQSNTEGVSCFKLERVGERVILEINGKLSKETIEKILNLVW